MPCVVNETYQQRPHQRYTLESLPQPLKKKQISNQLTSILSW